MKIVKEQYLFVKLIVTTRIVIPLARGVQKGPPLDSL
jgi:hypothetical protein